VPPAGDAIVEVVEKWHSGRNRGDEAAEIIVFYVGGKGQPITVKMPKPGQGPRKK